MKNRLITIMTILAFVLTPMLIRGEETNTQKSDNLFSKGWDLSDEEQSITAIKMTVFAFMFAATSALLSLLLPNSPASTTTTGSAASQNSSVF